MTTRIRYKRCMDDVIVTLRVTGEHNEDRPRVVDARYAKFRTNEAEAIAMLDALSGRAHEVLTGVAVRSAAGCRTALSSTTVRFRDIRPDEARRYWQSGEPVGKAGAYAIQGLGGVFVEAIAGSYSGVVGLPVFETARLLRDAGIGILPSLKDKQ